MKEKRDLNYQKGVLLTLAICLPVLVLYYFILIERKYSIIFGQQPFLVAQPMNFFESSVFLIIFVTEIIILLFSIAIFTSWLVNKFVYSNKYNAFIISIGLIVSCFIAITIQFQILHYFRDGIDLALAQSLGGGSMVAAIQYAKNELKGLLNLIYVSATITIIFAILLFHFRAKFLSWFRYPNAYQFLLTGKWLLSMNAILSLISGSITFSSPALDRSLSWSMAHYIYKIPFSYLTDFDSDGYDLIKKPRDTAPFNSNIHPYAFEIIGNSIDENGISGDLKKATNRNLLRYDWNISKFNQKNVILIVLETARADIIDARINNQWVMPNLRNIKGTKFNLFAHQASSKPSVVGILTGSIIPSSKGNSLFSIFDQMGYKTGVFSGQHEKFGNIADLTDMRIVDVFHDASTENITDRMYPSTLPTSLMMPAKIMNNLFYSWLATSDPTKPFFAYLNWQEMHFPYSYPKMPKKLESHTIPRHKIASKNHEWVRRTYMNAANVVDEEFANMIKQLKALEIFENTIIIIVGDHGEELFEHGSLGHGLNLSFEQNSTAAKLINSEWLPPNHPIGHQNIQTIIYNSLLKNKKDAVPIEGPLLCFVRSLKTPMQVGIFTSTGLIKYNFVTEEWSKQAALGKPFEKEQENNDIIHLWESTVLHYLGKESIQFKQQNNDIQTTR